MEKIGRSFPVIVGALVFHRDFALSEKFFLVKFFGKSVATSGTAAVLRFSEKNFPERNFSLIAKPICKTEAPTITGKLPAIFSSLFQVNFATCDSGGRKR